MDTPRKTEVEALAGATLMVGLPGTELSREDVEFLDDLRPGGVILFDRNLETPEQTRRLLRDLRRCVPDRSWFSIDQEGGRVSRMARWIGPTASALELVGRGPEVIHEFAATTARTLASLGFNMDFAPVVDLSPSDAPNGIGDRAYGVTPSAVIPSAAAFLAGLQDHRVAGCLKHFPGLGDTHVDSHKSLPCVTRTRAELQEDMEPYGRLAGESVAVMVGHGHYTAFDAEPTPATLSSHIVRKMLRGSCGFEGLVVSDDMEMGAVAAWDTEGGAAVQAIDAGCDLILYCWAAENAIRARDRLRDAAIGDLNFFTSLQTAARNVRSSASRWPVAADGREGPLVASELAKPFETYRPRA
ncbi:MAG: beta-N-acetylhexosaminidase [Acidobacteriota bacterium]|nr:beta-N-acetylhexosaminidase [Acidobacteriota bacterium]MDH3786862.1 beta-N-acetylhexosaminidase [Acidobacteriota bacterium]